MKKKIKGKKGKIGYKIFTRKENSQVVNELHHRIESAIERFKELSTEGYEVSLDSVDTNLPKNEDFKEEIN